MTTDPLTTVASRHGLTVEGLRQRLRDVRAEKRNDPSLCRYCEGPLPVGSSRKRHTCSTTCRTALSRLTSDGSTW